MRACAWQLFATTACVVVVAVAVVVVVVVFVVAMVFVSDSSLSSLLPRDSFHFLSKFRFVSFRLV